MPKDIDNNFTYHAPKEGQPERYAKIRAKAKELAELIDEISKSAGQVSEMASRVSTAMISINEITGQTAESSVATASAIGTLNQLAQERWNGKIDAELRRFGVKK